MVADKPPKLILLFGLSKCKEKTICLTQSFDRIHLFSNASHTRKFFYMTSIEYLSDMSHSRRLLYMT